MNAAGVRRAPATVIALMLNVAVAACSQGKNEAPASASAPAQDLGATLYGQNCVPCHREDGNGLPGVYPPLAGSVVANGDPAQLVRWVLALQRPPSMPAGRYSTQMLPFAWMKDAQAAAVLTYVRSHFGNSAPPIDAATVAAARP